MNAQEYLLKSSGEFADGVALLKDYAPNLVSPKIMREFERLVYSGTEPNNYYKSKLFEALSKVELPEDVAKSAVAIDGEDDGKKDSSPMEAKTAVPIEGEDDGKKDPSPMEAKSAVAIDGEDERYGFSRAVPEGDTPLHAHVKALHKEHSHYHTLLLEATTDTDRATIAAKVIAITSRLDNAYDRLRNGETTVERPTISGGEPDKALDGEKQLRKVQSLRSRISQTKAALATETDDDKKTVLQQRLDSLQKELGG